MAATTSSSLILILLIFSALANAALLPNTHSLSSSEEDRLLSDLQIELEFRDTPLLSVMGNHLVPLGDRQRMCGHKLAAFVYSVCGQPCKSKSTADIATTCCATACGVTFIKSACCP